MSTFRLSLAVVAAIATLAGALAGPANAGRKAKFCRWHPQNAWVCFYTDNRYRACDIQADGHQVRLWIRVREPRTDTDRHELKSYYFRMSKPGPKRCTGYIGRAAVGDVYQFRLCVDREGCTRWRWGSDGRVVR